MNVIVGSMKNAMMGNVYARKDTRLTNLENVSGRMTVRLSNIVEMNSKENVYIMYI